MRPPPRTRILALLAVVAAPLLPGTAESDGAWTPLRTMTARAAHSAIHDPVRQRMIVFGGFDGVDRNDVWALSLTGAPEWSLITPAGTAPAPRYAHNAIYDPVRDRMVVTGGRNSTLGLMPDTWELSLSGTPTWSPLAAAGAPPELVGHSAIYDPAGDRLIVFGGEDAFGTPSADTWSLDFAGSPAWTPLAPAGTPPLARAHHAAIYDAPRARMIVFGGRSLAGNLNDTWQLTLSGTPAWSQLDPLPGLPPARWGCSGVFDPGNGGRLVIHGGENDSGQLGDTWILSLARTPVWGEVTAPGGPAPGYAPSAIYDAGLQRMVVFGGARTQSGWNLILNDLAALTLSGTPAWSAIAPAGGSPGARAGLPGILDPLRDRMLVFGGFDGATVFDDVWELPLTEPASWARLATTGTPPPARALHTAIHDPIRDRVIVFGGADLNGSFNDVWTLDLSVEPPAWSLLAPTGAPPPPHSGHTAVYDPLRDRMIVFGTQSSADVWALSLSGGTAWSLLLAIKGGAITSHVAIYDPPRDRMVVFGGQGGASSDVLQLSLSGPPAWSPLVTTGAPPHGRDGAVGIYDPVRDRMVIAGGSFSDSVYNTLNDAWALDFAGQGGSWTELSPAGGPPPERYAAPGIYDPVRDRLVLYGGAVGSSFMLSDTWALLWGSPVNVAAAAPFRLRLGRPRPNPAAGETIVDFELAQAGRVTLEVFDVRGRRVRRIAEGWFPAGSHLSAWGGDDDRGNPVAAGVYFIRATTAGLEATRRAVRVR